MTVPFAVTKDVGNDGVARLRVTGGVDNNVSETLTALLINAIEHDDVQELVVDLTDAQFLSAAGLRCLLDARSTALRRGRGFRLQNPTVIVTQVLQVTGFAELLDPANPTT
ncbi:anti-anti-sigma factor [Actinoplanes tereljensis]|uniref:STAS domain-containing protein n=1 Tax=Paractinoplanes tereljensis TaxID=571912 RepID=UPI0019403C8A|nr:STAS domain-containing protein [Actinoplanes tereljensis]